MEEWHQGPPTELAPKQRAVDLRHHARPVIRQLGYNVTLNPLPAPN